MIDTNDNTIFQLAALVIQAVAGDYTKFVFITFCFNKKKYFLVMKQQ